MHPSDINPADWYYQGQWRNTLFFTTPWIALGKISLRKEAGLDEVPVDMIYVGGHLFCLHQTIDAVRPRVAESVEGKNDWISTAFGICDQEMDKLRALEGSTDVRAFIDQMVRGVNTINLMLLTDYALEPLLKQYAEREGITVDRLMSWMTPKKKTPSMVYEERLHECRNEEAIDQLLEDYRWLGTKGFAGEVLTKEKILATQALAHSQKKNVAEEFPIPSSLQKVVAIGSELAFQRSNIIETINRISFGYWDQLKGLAEKHGITFKDLTYLAHYEVLSLLDGGDLPPNLEKRKQAFGASFVHGKWEIYAGVEVTSIVDRLLQKSAEGGTELKGMCAYKGVVRGRVAIVGSTDDVKKVQDGDVLVASETHPHYMMGLRKAAAFVTNTGGITSHAAILAREMHKPCIIGTKTATQILKDGDLIEVDAVNGIVKVLERA